MFHRFLSLIALIVSGYFACAQATYSQSAGIRLGQTSAMTFKKFVIDEEALEISLSGRKDGLQMTAMYIFHLPMEFSFNENFYAYYGLGGHFGFEKFSRLDKTLTSIDPPTFVFEDRSYYTMGADAIIGLEYRWLSVPVTIGFDIKPYINFVGLRYLRNHFWDSGISFKYVF